jgi:Cdc6-like AAA superfamily ATPase
LKYTASERAVTKKTPFVDQQTIIDEIIKTVSLTEHAIVLLTGPAGTGKSYIPLLLCKELLKTTDNVYMVDTFNPAEPGDSFSSLYLKIAPTKKAPLVVVIEEIDIMMMKIHTGNITDHKYIPIQVKDKASWNMFLDRFDREMYPHVIFIMTTNKSATFFDDLDPSYMRKGRVNLKYECLQNDNLEQ